MQFTESHQFWIDITKLICGCVVQIIGAVALYHSTPKPKSGNAVKEEG